MTNTPNRDEQEWELSARIAKRRRWYDIGSTFWIAAWALCVIFLETEGGGFWLPVSTAWLGLNIGVRWTWWLTRGEGDR